MTEELQKSRRDLLKMQFEVRNGTSKEVHMVKNLKRYIAKLQTIAQELKLEMKPSGMGKAEAAPASEDKEEKKPVAKKAAAAPKKTATKTADKAPAAKKAKAPAKK